MFKTLKFLSFLAIAAAFLQCSGNANSLSSGKAGTVPGVIAVAPEEATSVSAKITADSGGQLSIGNSVHLTIPAGALAEDTQIAIAKTAVAPAKDNIVPVMNSFELGAHGIEFNKPVAFSACYDAGKMAQQNLKEETLAVYYVDPVTGEYSSVGGLVNKTTHCVTAGLQHFSTYVVAAQNLASFGNQQPAISGVSLLPIEPIAGLPLKITAIVTDFELPPAGPVGFGQIATVRLCYFVATPPAAPGCASPVNMTPDYDDDTNIRYSYVVPANQIVNGQTIYYSVTATDNLGLQRTRSFSRVINRGVASFFILNDAAVDLAAGFKRSFTIRATTDYPGDTNPHNVVFDAFLLTGGIGTAVKTTPSVVQVTATTANPQTFRPGNLTINAGSYSVTSQVIRVHAGLLDHISLLSPAGVVLGNSLSLNSGQSYDFDVLGYDAYGNTSYILPLFSLAPNPFVLPPENPGTVNLTGLYAAPTVTAPRILTLTANLNGVLDQIVINVGVAPVAGLIGEPDPTFGGTPVPGAIAFPGFGPYQNGSVGGVVLDSADNLYATGYTYDVNSNRQMFVTRFDAVTNAVSLWYTASGFTNSEGIGLAFDGNGNLLVSGISDNLATVWRILPNGAIDPAFAGGTGIYRLPIVGSRANKQLAIDSTNGVVVPGWKDGPIVFRLDQSGSLITTFGGNNDGIAQLPFLFPLVGQSNTADRVLLTSTGEVFVMGLLRTDPNRTDGALWKLDFTSGLLVSGFGTGGYMTYGSLTIDDQFFGIARESSGRLIIAGLSYLNGSGTDTFVIAVDPNTGLLDPSYGSLGVMHLDTTPGSQTFGLGLALEAGTNRALVTGSALLSSVVTGCIWGVTTQGALDTTFGTAANGRGCFASMPAILGLGVSDSQGRVVAVGSILSGNFGYTENTPVIVRYR